MRVGMIVRALSRGILGGWGQGGVFGLVSVVGIEFSFGLLGFGVCFEAFQFSLLVLSLFHSSNPLLQSLVTSPKPLTTSEYGVTSFAAITTIPIPSSTHVHRARLYSSWLEAPRFKDGYDFVSFFYGMGSGWILL